ncbi:MAG: spore germination protein [Firmicutes bacterium]|nr:spore germination protein [Bacillota bacterium]
MGLTYILLQKFISLLSYDPPNDRTKTVPDAGVLPESAITQQGQSESGQDTRSARQRIKDRRKSRSRPSRVQSKRPEGIKLTPEFDFTSPLTADLPREKSFGGSPGAFLAETSSEISPSTGKANGDEVKPFAESLDKNMEMLKRVLHYGTNADVVIREFDIPTDPKTEAAILFMEGLAARDAINFAILQPLMLIANLDDTERTQNCLELVKRRLLPGNQVTEKDNLRGIIEDVLSGTTCLLIDGSDIALSIETRAWEHRGIEKPSAEMVVRGPQEAFSETLRSNLALIRRRMRTPDLITEMLKVGTLSRTDCALLYIEGLTNPQLVDEARKRIQTITSDHIQDTGILEQFIEEKPYVLAPQTISTERPDRMAAFLAEGYVGIMLDGSPFGLVLPATFWSLLQSAEDYFLRWPFGAFLRLVRMLALILAIFLPAVYLALTNFHPEMIPTDLLLAIAASREKVPFPTAIEVLIMEVSIELIREAGVRIPGVIGPTLGIVGALILGQAAVAASIVSPILVVIVAITALGAFAVPNFNMAFAIRLYRFMYILLAAALGFYGVAIGVFIQLVTYVNLKSFGVPYMSPVAPHTRSSGDALFRFPVWKSEIRPSFLKPQQEERQPRISRGWIKGHDENKRSGTSQANDGRNSEKAKPENLKGERHGR